MCPQQILLDVSKHVKPVEAQAMDIAIIGSGNVGGALARAFTRSGHTVRITARNRERALSLIHI